MRDSHKHFVELPCRIGDQVYTIGVSRKTKEPTVIIHTVEGFDIGRSGIDVKLDWISMGYELKRSEDLGETWFLTREDAEQKMERREDADALR